MNFERAKEIFHSPETIEVFYQGESVWIEELHEDGQTARIHLENDEHRTVPVRELSENH